MVSSCMLCGKPIDRKTDKGRYLMNIEVDRVREAPSPFVRGNVRARERAMMPLWMCDGCGRSIIGWIEGRRIE